MLNKSINILPNNFTFSNSELNLLLDRFHPCHKVELLKIKSIRPFGMLIVAFGVGFSSPSWSKAPSNMQVQDNSYSDVQEDSSSSADLWSDSPMPTSGDAKKFKTGDCSAPSWGKRTCKIADSSWYCALAGIDNVYEAAGAVVSYSDGAWYASSHNKKYAATVTWSCISL